MVMTSDQVDLIEELLLGCGPGSGRADRAAIAVGVLRNQEHESLQVLASWFLGACAGLLEAQAGRNDPVMYRVKVYEIMGTLR